ncbi:uncharacterized protein F5Z01DRAFT_546440 [Emericellopsis atlantica]|uniref:Uncharacterized protein n=1 Tax=Emericellopsis atlantica TaxID=2614577 RepID=A0A9P8CQP9_9HYPO|nr:uncharacterized protein F5Z01DRAFT_546440 [Emericellopsis atlantica]KAG9255537.1 hypothetical protein F5Z01DRAFT_546440 [Emericellopsis atlantica]
MKFFDSLRDWYGTAVHLSPQDPGRLQPCNRGIRERMPGSKSWTQQDSIIHLTGVDLAHWPTELLKTSVIHMAKTLDEMEAEIAAFEKCRYLANQTIPAPRIVWEYMPQPGPAADLTAQKERFKNFIARHVEVVCIKWEDLVKFFPRGDGLPQTQEAALPDFATAATEMHADALTESRTTMVVSCGQHGYLYYGMEDVSRWYPPYHEPADVVDAKYSFSAFVGGFSVAYAAERGVVAGMICGIVAESFCLEQCGLPDIRPSVLERRKKKLRVNGRDAGWRAKEYIDFRKVDNPVYLLALFYSIDPESLDPQGTLT